MVVGQLLQLQAAQELALVAEEVEVVEEVGVILQKQLEPQQKQQELVEVAVGEVVPCSLHLHRPRMVHKAVVVEEPSLQLLQQVQVAQELLMLEAQVEVVRVHQEHSFDLLIHNQ